MTYPSSRPTLGPHLQSGEPEILSLKENRRTVRPTDPVDSEFESADQEGEVGESADLSDEALQEQAALGEVDAAAATAGELALRKAGEASGGGEAISKWDPLQAYMREVQQHSLLTREEEHEIAKEYVEGGDLDAAARLVTANLRLVVKIAYEYRRAYRNMMDLIQEGNIGLMQAVKRYDPYRGVKLSSYAAWWIRAYMLRYILNNWRMVKLGTTQAQRKLFFNLNKEKARLSAMGIEPTHEVLAERLSVTEKEVTEMDRRMSASDASLDVPVGGDDNAGVARVELLSSSSLGPEQATTNAELGEIVHRELGKFRTTLSGKDAVIFDRRMVADEPLTLQELGNEFGVSRERVRQLEARISRKLREFLKQTLGDAMEVES